MDEGLRRVPVVLVSARAVQPVAGILGRYAGGSLAWGDFQPGRSDLGPITLARAEATLTGGRLITEREALTRLHRFRVDQELAQQIARRRHGQAVHLTPTRRLRRAHTARRLLAHGIRTLSQHR